MSIFILATIAGYLNSLRGRGLSEKYGLIYSKAVFISLICLLIFTINHSWIEALAGFAVFAVMLWTGTGGLMQAFTGKPQKEKEFLPVDLLTAFITKTRGWEEGFSPSSYRRYGVVYASFIGLIQAIIAFCFVGFNFGILLLLSTGLIVGSMRYLPEKIKTFSWLFCEILLGAVMFLSVTL